LSLPNLLSIPTQEDDPRNDQVWDQLDAPFETSTILKYRRIYIKKYVLMSMYLYNAYQKQTFHPVYQAEIVLDAHLNCLLN
jgi:hypothetical protein